MDYEIKFRNTSRHGNADALSHLANRMKKSSIQWKSSIHISQMDAIPVSSARIRRETQYDPILAKVYTQTLDG